MGIKFSQFGAATTPTQNDVVVGLQDGTNRKFSLGALLAWIKAQISPADIGAVPDTRKINTKVLSSDITLTAADVSAIPASEKGAASGVATLDAAGKVPAAQLDLSGKQDEITASGILKGNGAGGVSAAAAGTDYGTYSKPSGGIPKTDLASGVQTSLGLADTAYQKPSGGIPASDLASGVIPTVPSASATNPAMDGNASPGSSVAWARGDHVHPSDTSRIPTSAKGVANGVATLDAAGKLPASQLPGIVVDAADVSYDGGTSGLPSTDVQGAIDDLNTFILDVEAEIPPVPSPSPTVPAMDGTASVGSEPLWARGDHVHPTDTSRVPTARTVNGKALSADITLDANDIDYDPSTSGLVAGTVQEAIDEFTLGTLSEIDRLDAAISARYTATTIYNTLTDVHTDTTITMDHSFTHYKFLMIIFNTQSPASSGKRIPLVVSTNALPQGGFYAIANPDAQGYVRLNYVSGQAKQLRVQSTNFSALYIASVSGLT